MSANLVVKLGMDSSAFQRGMSSATSSLKSFAGVAAGVFAAGAVAAGFKKMIGDAMALYGRLGDIADRLGIAAQKMQILGNVASQNGSSLSDVERAMQRLSVSISKAIDSDDAMIIAFRQIGLSVDDLKKQNVESVFDKIADAIESGKLEGKEFALAMELMGRTGVALVPMMKMGSSAINEMGANMGVLTNEQVAALQSLNDHWTRFQTLLGVVGGQIASEFAPLLEIILFMLTDLANLTRFILTNLERIIPGLRAVADIAGSGMNMYAKARGFRRETKKERVAGLGAAQEALEIDASSAPKKDNNLFELPVVASASQKAERTGGSGGGGGKIEIDFSEVLKRMTGLELALYRLAVQ